MQIKVDPYTVLCFSLDLNGWYFIQDEPDDEDLVNESIVYSTYDDAQEAYERDTIEWSNGR